ncbi:hypothetical protein AHV77_000624 [Salmonella enterica subsp. houtenae]|nr:hypothetical protein [Salmonella enterica subsp. houtenae]
MKEVKIYTIVSDQLSPPITGESFCTDMVRHSDYAELEAKCMALVAENHTARNAVQTFCDVVGANTDAICEEVGQDGVKVILEAMSATGNMPATDAFLAEVRAQGVEMMREHPSIKLCSLTHICDELAAQLRKGAAL